MAAAEALSAVLPSAEPGQDEPPSTEPEGPERHPSRSGGNTGAKMAELDAADAAVFGAQPCITRCDIDDCKWKHDGTADEGREAAVVHRRADHPDRPAHPTRRRNTKSLSLKNRWTRESALEAGRRFVEREGRAPTSADLGGELPTYDVLRRMFGSYPDYHVALGLPRPVQGRRRIEKPPLVEEPEEAPADVEPVAEPEPDEARPAETGVLAPIASLTADELEILGDVIGVLARAHRAGLAARTEVVLGLAGELAAAPLATVRP